MGKDEVKDKEAEKEAKKKAKKEQKKEEKKEAKKEEKRKQKKEEKRKAKKEQKKEEKSDNDSNSDSNSDNNSHSDSDTDTDTNKFDPLINIPFYPFKYIAKNKAGDILNEYFTTFQVQILKNKIVNYIVNLYFLNNDNLLEKFEFQIKRTKSNIKKNAKRLFQLIKDGYPGRDGNDYNRAVTAVIKRRNDPPSSVSDFTYSAAATDQTVESVTVGVTSPPAPYDFITIGFATYYIITTQTSEALGTVFLGNYITTSTTPFQVPLTITDPQGFSYQVVSIGNPNLSITPSSNGFTGATSVTSITFELNSSGQSNVTTFGNNSFAGCTSLNSIVIPATIFGTNVFLNCTSLVTVTINTNIASFSSVFPSGATTIQNITFNNCNVADNVCLNYTALKTIAFNNVTTIGTSSFYGCKGFNFLTIPASIVSLGNSVFQNCSGLVTFNFPSTGSLLTTIGNSAFQGTSVNNPNYIGNCSNLTYIGQYAFYGTYIRALTLPSPSAGLIVDDFAFANNNTLGNSASGGAFNLGTSLVSIGNNAFQYVGTANNVLASVTIPASVTTIGANAFNFCRYLSSIYFSGTSSNSPLTIGTNAFGVCGIYYYLKTVTLPGNLTSLGASAFYGCSQLTNIIFPYSGKSLTSIGSSAFQGTRLTYANLNDCLNLTNIGQYAFYGVLLRVLNLPTPPVTGLTVGDYAFANNYTMGNVNGTGTIYLGNNVVSIGTGAFQNVGQTYNWLQYINIPATVTSIGASAFNGCYHLTNVIFASSGSLLTSIGNSAFQGTSLYYASNFNLCSNLTYIGQYAFYDLYLQAIGLPNTTAPLTVDSYAFYNNNYANSLNLGTNLVSIGEYAFNNVGTKSGRYLYSITIPASVQTIKQGAFYSTTYVNTVTYQSNATITWSSIFNQGNIKTLIIDNPTITGTNNVLITGGPAYVSTIILSGNVTTINSVCAVTNGFTGVSILTFNSNVYNESGGPCNITTNFVGSNFSTVTYNNAIVGSSTSSSGLLTNLPATLKNLTMPNATTVSQNAFLNALNLTAITFPVSITNIGISAFQGITSLLSISIPNTTNPLVIGDNAFNNCTGAVTVTLGNKITSIGSVATSDYTPVGSVFYNCAKFTTVTIPASVISIGPSAFVGCSNLTTLLFPSSGSTLTSIGVSAFQGLTKLGTGTGTGLNINIPATTSPLVIGNSAFYGCTGSPALTLSSSIDYANIGDSIFEGCAGLIYAQLPTNFTTISNSMFSGCSNLTYIGTTPATATTNWFYSGSSTPSTTPAITSVGSSAFYNCAKLSILNVNSSLTSVGSSAFSGCSNINFVSIPGPSNTNTGTGIGSTAFYGCSALTSVNIPNLLGTVSNSIFYPSIQPYVFSGCSLKNITFANTVPPVQGTTSISLFTQGITSVGANAFANNANLTLAYLINGSSSGINISTVQSVDENAFDNCTSLATIGVCTRYNNDDTNIVTVDDTAFSSCTPLLGTSSSGAIYTDYTNNTINIVNTSVNPPITSTQSITNYFTSSPFSANNAPLTNTTIIPT